MKAGRPLAPARRYLRKRLGLNSEQASSVGRHILAQLEGCRNEAARRLLLGKGRKEVMTIRELHELVEQIGAHVNTLAQQQVTINKFVHEGLRQTHEDIQALLQIAQRHEDRLNGSDQSK